MAGAAARGNVRALLRRGPAAPLVEAAPSAMPGAGRGVFVAGPEPVESGTALCLYPAAIICAARGDRERRHAPGSGPGYQQQHEHRCWGGGALRSQRVHHESPPRRRLHRR